MAGTSSQCKYDKVRLSQIVAERGIVAALEDISPSAISDDGVKKLWQEVHERFERLESLLEN